MAPVASSNPDHDMNALISRALCRIAQTLTLCALTIGMAWAVSPFTARDIRIEGLQRVEAGLQHSDKREQEGWKVFVKTVYSAVNS
jgi:hypothetical protein